MVGPAWAVAVFTCRFSTLIFPSTATAFATADWSTFRMVRATCFGVNIRTSVA